MTLGTNIRDLRKKHKLSLRQLADKIPTSASTIFDIENDSREPGVFLTKDIAKALKTTIGKLLQ